LLVEPDCITLSLVHRSYLIRIVAIYTIISAAFRNSDSKTLNDGSTSEVF
jgi:hypothetical protein